MLQPTALEELLPEWREDADCPVHRQPATASRFYYLTSKRVGGGVGGGVGVGGFYGVLAVLKGAADWT